MMQTSDTPSHHMLCQLVNNCIVFSLLSISAVVRASVIVLCPRAKHITPHSALLQPGE